MRARPRSSRVSALLLTLLVTVFALPVSAVFQNDFSSYPAGAQPCLVQADTASKCNGDTVTAMNACLCGNTGGQFVTSAARCLGASNVASNVIAQTYDNLVVNCNGSNTPLALSKDAFLLEANPPPTTTRATTTTPAKTTSSSSVTKPTSSKSTAATSATTLTTVSDGHTITVTQTGAQPTETNKTDGDIPPSGLSTGAVVGIALGSSLGALILGALAFLLYRRRRNPRSTPDDSNHPMLGPGNTPAPYNPVSGFSASHSHSPQPSLQDFNAYGQQSSHASEFGYSASVTSGAAQGTIPIPPTGPWQNEHKYYSSESFWRPTDPNTLNPPVQPPPVQSQPYAWSANPTSWIPPTTGRYQSVPGAVDDEYKYAQRMSQPEVYELSSAPSARGDRPVEMEGSRPVR